MTRKQKTRRSVIVVAEHQIGNVNLRTIMRGSQPIERRFATISEMGGIQKIHGLYSCRDDAERGHLHYLSTIEHATDNDGASRQLLD
jgi:hypothetical protein